MNPGRRAAPNFPSEWMTSYKEIRTTGRALQGKLLDATRHLDFNAIRIAKQMTLPVVGRTLVFDGEADQHGFFDFWFHEYRVNGKSLVESVDPVALGLSPLETDVLAAHCRSRTSLFAPEALVPGADQIRLKDLLNPAEPPVLLTDQNWSQTCARLGVELTMFLRLLEIRGITMTSGFSFVFPLERATGLLQAYRQKTKKVPPPDLSRARFVFFFQKYRQFGEAQEFRDVV